MKIYEFHFSPTGGTKKTADILTEKLASEIKSFDLTDNCFDFSEISLKKDDIAVIAVPSYGGRVPEPAARRISTLKGNGARAVLLCVFGGRAYEDTLVELHDTAKSSGFRIIAAVSAIAEHSIVHHMAAGRPDTQDQTSLAGFSEKILEKISSGNITEPSIPGNRPYKKRGVIAMTPMPNSSCTKCGLCAEKCPVQSIDKKDPAKLNTDTCISCMRCVYICPHSAREANAAMISKVERMLKKVCSERKECELFI